MKEILVTTPRLNMGSAAGVASGAAVRPASSASPSDPVEVLQVLYPPLMRAAWHIAGADAEDLVQEALLQILLHRPGFRGIVYPLGYAKTTMFRLAHRRFHRREVRTIPLDVAALMDRPESTGWEEQVDQRLDAREALKKIGSKRGACVYLRYIEGLTDLEIASVLGCRPSTVRSQISRALQSMKDQWILGDEQEAGKR